MNYQNIRIDTIQDVLFRVYGVYTTVCDRDTFEPVRTNAPSSEVVRSLIYLDSDCRETPDGKPFAPGTLYFYSNSLDMIWCFVVESGYLYMLGPAFTDNFSMLDIMDKLDTHHLSQPIKAGMMEFIRGIPIVSAQKMYQYGFMLYCAITEQTLSMENVQTLYTRNSNTDERITQEISTNYVLEQNLWKAVREGNLNFHHELESVMTRVTPGYISDGKYLRQEKNMAIIQVALACRASVEGGVSPEIAYPLSDQYIQKIESCTTASEVLDLSSGLLDDYIRRVYHVKLQSGVSSQILACCNQISMHPETNPDLEQIAKKCGYSPYYFSRKFKQEMGMTIRDFAMKQKIEKAKVLLLQNTMSVADISEHLGFNSQSYFGSIFRKEVGMTPSEYQLRHGTSPMESNE